MVVFTQTNELNIKLRIPVFSLGLIVNMLVILRVFSQNMLLIGCIALLVFLLAIEIYMIKYKKMPGNKDYIFPAHLKYGYISSYGAYWITFLLGILTVLRV